MEQREAETRPEREPGQPVQAGTAGDPAPEPSAGTSPARADTGDGDTVLLLILERSKMKRSGSSALRLARGGRGVKDASTPGFGACRRFQTPGLSC